MSRISGPSPGSTSVVDTVERLDVDATVTPADDTSAPLSTGLDRATDHGPAPHADDAPLPPASDGMPVPAGLSHVAARLAGRRQQGLFDLVPGRAPAAVGLPQVLAAMASDPRSRAAVEGIIAQFQQQTGVRVPDALVTAVLADPSRLTDVLQLTPEEMSAGFDALNASARARGSAGSQPRPRLLPQRFDLGRLGRTDIARPEAKLEELAPGLLRGDVKSELSDEQAKANMAMAEIFDRLADNAGTPPDQRFEVKYGDHRFTRLDSFLRALERDGHEVEVQVVHRVANFASLMTRAPDGSLLDVPAPLMVRTGFADAQGNEAVVPAVHSELVIKVRRGPDTQGPGLDADVKWYQGVPHTGFFPKGLNREPPWLGGTVADTFHGAQALEATALAGLLSDIIKETSADQGLVMSGYGVTGVCNDTVAIVQHAMTGRATGYPLLMRDTALIDELAARLGDADHRDDPEYRQLRQSIDAVPSDVDDNASARARALASLPWLPGAEPLQSTVAARQILEADGA